ncbi:Isochorismatase hydrolase [Rhizodiscina lignyota]|uniref:Isochorismatase hydrolase n=1 Tax=Rhizodiscina lignyota TaxID=1504668 RepID=A0A9P4I6H9_9PEZI|nr:Isochorismatase hydrolase [Rhizodiscina lignyota]
MESHDHTAVVLVDPYNDFLHPDGKLYPAVKDSLQASDSIKHMKRLVEVARAAHIPIYYGLHKQYKEGFYDGWHRMTSSHIRTKKLHVFEEGSFGVNIYEGMEPDIENGDVIASKHWNSSSFANTDLDYLLRQRNITKVVCAGMASTTCLESTARYARELGYDVTLLSDATAGFSIAANDAAVNLVWPLIVDRVLTVEEWAASVAGSKL